MRLWTGPVRGALLCFAILFLAPGLARAQDAGQPPAPHVPFELPFVATDVVFDVQRGMLYATSAADQRVYFVDLASGLATRQFDFPWTPEHLTLTPDGSRLFVTLLTRAHSPYWFDGDHEGYIASFDLDLQVKDREFWIPEDPFGIVATSDERLVVSSGSGQWTDIHVFDARNGAKLATAARSIRERSNVTLHPDEDAVYTSGGSSSPQDLHRWDLTPSGDLVYAWDSIYHGGQRIGGTAWITPDGERVISQWGGIFSAGQASRTTDLVAIGGLGTGSYSDLDIDPLRRVIVAASGQSLSYYNLDSLEFVDAVSFAADVDFVGVVGLDVYTLSGVAAGSLLERSDHLVPNGDTNTPPLAAFDFDPTSGWDTNLDGVLDATSSSDAESGLLYRWDLDDDGVWDTPFEPSPTRPHRFHTAGTKFVALQVKDAAGAVDGISKTLDVAFANDPGTPGPTHASFTLPFEVSDAAFDPVRPYVYVSSRDRQEVHFVNLQTGFIEKSFDFPWMAERLAVTPDGARLYVALLVQDHSSYWDEGEQEGYIASFDLELQEKDRQYRIETDPYDLVATRNGQLVVTSGSGQWTYAYAFDGATGATLSSIWSIRQGTRISLHPSEAIVYGADNGLSPSDIERYDLDATGKLTFRWDSIYHGDHRMSGNVWASPLGDLLITRGGDVFSAAGVDRQSDMIYQRGLSPNPIEALAYDPVRQVIFAGRDTQLAYYNLQSLEPIGQTTLPGDVSFVGVDGLDVYAVEVEGGETRILRLDHPLPGGDTDTPPRAGYIVQPEGELTTQTDITFDASGSSDPEGSLVYRWDLDGDGEWDTDFLPEPVLVHRFDTAGTKLVSVQVKDEAGFVSVFTFSLLVLFQADEGAPGAEHAPFVLDFPVTDVAFDPLRPYAYVSSQDDRQVHFVNLETGRVERTFSFNWMPEALSITPDGSRLFVGLLTRHHSPYWFDGDHEGYVASFDLELRVKDRQFWIAEDPYDLLATSNGQLVVSSGSGQHTYVRVFDATNGALLSANRSIYHRTRLALHPSEAMVYGADTTVSPSDIERFDLDPAGNIVRRWDSIYHGDHRMSGNVWISPEGDRLISRGGDVFTAAGVDRNSDIIFVDEMSPILVEDLVYDDLRNAIFTGHDGEVRYFNSDSLEEVGSLPVEGFVRFLGLAELRLFAVADLGGQTRIVGLDHPLPEGDRDTPPVARIEVRPPTGSTTLTDVELDASGSTDAWGPLAFRWDLDDDGVWDTPYSAAPVLVHRFSIAGTKFIRLRVKDTGGNVDEALLALDVAFEPDPGMPGPVQPSYVLPFQATDAIFDPARPYAYVTSAARRELHVVDLNTGFITRTFTFDEMPDHLAMTPDGSKLFVGLPVQPHSSYYWDDEQSGFIARFDLDLQVKDRQFAIDLDPFDLAATDDGRVVVTSGSGQWTRIDVFDGDTGAALGTSGRSIRERSSVSLHPDGDRVYTAGGTSYPQDVHRWDLLPGPTGGIVYAYDSIYHGQHRVGSSAWVSPRGDVVITAGADVFSADGTTRATDLQYLRSLPASAIDDLVWSPALNEFATIDGGVVRVYDMTTYAELASFGVSGTGQFIGRLGSRLFALQVGAGTSEIELIDRGP